MALMFSAGLLLTNALLTPFAAHAETSTESKNYEIDGLYWDDMDNKIIAGWDEAEDKTSYKVKLFRNGKGISTYLTTNKESYDFTSYIVEKGSGNYTFYVYPTKLGKSSQKVSETLYVDGDLHADIKKAFTKKGTPTPGSTANNTGTATGATTGLHGGPGTSSTFTNQVDTGKTGWVFHNNLWYWVDESHTLANNTWRQVEGKWYFFDGNSAMKTGWVEWKGLWYYLGADGAMLTDTQTPDGYFVNAEGVWVK